MTKLFSSWLSAGWLLVLSLWLGVLACEGGTSQQTAREQRLPAAEPAAQREAVATFAPGSAARGKALVAQFECNRCHEGTGLAAPRLDRDCVGCHEQIATDKFDAPAHKLARWKPHIMAYRDVPSLTGMGERLRPDWVMSYLLEPQDLRPSLLPNMPRLPLEAEQARDIATYLTATATASTSTAKLDLQVTAGAEQVSSGRRLFETRGCLGCHALAERGRPVQKVERTPRAVALAPDLRFARARFEPSVLASWLLNPSKLKPDTAMPNLGLAPQEASDLAAFLVYSTLEPLPLKVPSSRLPLLSRRVGFEEVNQRVFSVTCRHCHTNPDLAGGDGGPGNTGGFGFAARKIDFSSYQGIQSGGVDRHGNRVSLFAPISDGTPRLVAALLARAREEAGHVSSEVRGMPLGLPALDAEQIQLVESWVEQGRPL
jgi:cytochrome c2